MNAVFLVSDLKMAYLTRLSQLRRVEVETLNEHTTRFKEKLLKHIPDLWESKQGKDTLLMFSENVGPVIHSNLVNDRFENAKNLVKTIENIRKIYFNQVINSMAHLKMTLLIM